MSTNSGIQYELYRSSLNIFFLPNSCNLQVKYLGQSDARGLWGIKHTRKPVDLMVAAAKALPPGNFKDNYRRLKDTCSFVTLLKEKEVNINSFFIQLYAALS